MGKVGGWIVWPVEDPSGPGGRRARTARTKHGRGPLAPAHALVLRAPWARKTPPSPGVTQRLPPPLRQRASASHTAVGCGHRKEGADMRGAAAFGGQGGGPAGRPPGLPNKRAGPGAKGPGPALSGRFASCRGLQSSDSLSRYCANIAVRVAPAAGVELAVRVLPHSRCRAWFSPW